MFKQKQSKKLDPRVKYQRPQFKQQLARARSHRRPSGMGFFGRLLLALRGVRWRAVLIGLAIAAAAFYVCFVSNPLFTRTVVVNGVSDAVRSEIEQQAQQYLSGRYLALPRRNLLFLSRKDLADYIAVVNPHVWQVTRVEKQWPSTIVLSVLAREPVFAWSHESEHAVIGNDGTVLPEGEAQGRVLLTVTGLLPGRAVVGEKYVSGSVLSTLMVLKNSFASVTNMPELSRVEFVPLIAKEQAPLASPSPVAPTGIGVVPTPTQLPPVPTPLNVAPQELRAHVPAHPPRGTPSFVVLFSVSADTVDALQKLKILLAEQPASRLARLAYVDMRLPSRAFICLQNTPCATSPVGAQ